MAEIEFCLKKTKNNIAPGSSGFTGAFYKAFWPVLKYIVHKTINAIYSNDKIPDSLRFGIINIIPKEQKDQRHLSNWRPLTLLNTLYKLISSILAERLKKVLNRILGPHQKAYIPNRFISEATKNTHDVIEQAIRTKNPGLAILVDFEKAFDSVSFSFIQKTLEIFGFGDNFRKWINILLGNSSTRKRFVGVSVVNGYPTTQFKILRGCRQGDPIAGYLFVLCIEILALTLKN